MRFCSTRNNQINVKFSQAVQQCTPQDGGVFVPDLKTIEDLRRWIYYIDESTSFNSIAGTLTSAFIQDEFSPIICQTIAEKAFPFAPKVTQLDDNLFHLELTTGYTGCHRDFGVSYLCSYLETTHALQGGSSVFLDFTNGELGALLANVLRGKKNIKAVLVYKKGTVRGLEEQDYVWNGGNILPVEMEGSEEEIKSAINQIFLDKDFVARHNLTVANTTNICRLLSQVFIFPYAFAQIKHKTEGDIYYAMEPGNYGTLMAGLYSWRFALPVNGFYLPSTPALCADSVGKPLVLDSIVAMENREVSNPVIPANLERLEAFFEGSKGMMSNFVFPCDISEKQREKAAKELYIKYGLFAGPGTASAYASIKEGGQDVFDEDGAFILVSQNHPALDLDYCRHVIGEAPEMPSSIQKSLHPVVLNRPEISGVDELKKMIEGNL